MHLTCQCHEAASRWPKTCISFPLMSSRRLRLVPSRSGQPDVEVEGVPYHSPYNPRREAQQFYSEFQIEKADVVLHFGWGLGYAGEVLRDRIKPSARVIVFEPDAELFELSMAQMNHRVVLQDHRFRFVVGSQVCQFFDDWPLEQCQETDEFLWLVWPPASRAHGPVAESLMANFKTRLRDRAANLLTHFQNGMTYFRNVLENFDYQSDPDVGRLFGRFTNLPLVIVSAGPSLDRNIMDLRKAENRCFVLAVDTALRPLLAAGVIPHAVIIADPSELNARHIVGAMPPSTHLIAEQAVHSSALASAARRFLFGLGLFPDSLFAKFGFAKSRLDVWGSVATAALDLACRMGANPVIFTGQDFAYSWGRDYASYTIFDGNPFCASDSGRASANDIWGRQVHTTENLIAYRDFFVRKMRQTSGVRFINATEGGILGDKVEILSLRDALHQSCRRPVDIPQILDQLHSPSLQHASYQRLQALEHLTKVLQSQTSDCGCLSGFLELAAKEHVLKGDREAIARSIQSGLSICEGRVMPAFREPGSPNPKFEVRNPKQEFERAPVLHPGSYGFSTP